VIQSQENEIKSLRRLFFSILNWFNQTIPSY